MPFQHASKGGQITTLDFTRKMRHIAFQLLKKIIVSLFSGLFRVPILGYSIGTGWKNRKLALFLDFSGPISGRSGLP